MEIIWAKKILLYVNSQFCQKNTTDSETAVTNQKNTTDSETAVTNQKNTTDSETAVTNQAFAYILKEMLTPNWKLTPKFQLVPNKQCRVS
jgi:hypothetical protein